ncbi:hypothetical protein J6590_033075 [Homalodisca vitripennis]|nr:hypothetical protein J6590_033075 [Homalodisca vitripennis]
MLSEKTLGTLGKYELLAARSRGKNQQTTEKTVGCDRCITASSLCDLSACHTLLDFHKIQRRYFTHYRMHLRLQVEQVLAGLVLECLCKAERDVICSLPPRFPFPDAMDQSSTSTYRPPSSDNSTTLQTETYAAIVNEFLRPLALQRIWSLGDFNINVLNFNAHMTERFADLLRSFDLGFGLDQLIHQRSQRTDRGSKWMRAFEGLEVSKTGHARDGMSKWLRASKSQDCQRLRGRDLINADTRKRPGLARN